jgi:hypothetical protein
MRGEIRNIADQVITKRPGPPAEGSVQAQQNWMPPVPFGWTGTPEVDSNTERFV